MSRSGKILVTCPPMLGMIDQFRPAFKAEGFSLTAPTVVQTLSIDELKQLVPEHDGWIIGDDPATREVFYAGREGRLKAAVKWGVGVDNVDFAACESLGIPIANTPGMFGEEVADIALGYVIALARETFQIDAAVRTGEWPKPRGISLRNKVAALIGLGDIGKATVQRLLACGVRVIAYDPFADDQESASGIERAVWPDRLNEADFLIATCALSESSRRMINSETLAKAKPGVRVVNVSRGGIIDQYALEEALASGVVYSAALDVFEREPLPLDAPMRSHPRCIFGSHNASNTAEAVIRTSESAMSQLFAFLRGMRKGN